MKEQLYPLWKFLFTGKFIIANSNIIKLIETIIKFDLLIFYLSLTALIITFVVIVHKYVKKIKA